MLNRLKRHNDQIVSELLRGAVIRCAGVSNRVTLPQNVTANDNLNYYEHDRNGQLAKLAMNKPDLFDAADLQNCDGPAQHSKHIAKLL